MLTTETVSVVNLIMSNDPTIFDELFALLTP